MVFPLSYTVTAKCLLRFFPSLEVQIVSLREYVQLFYYLCSGCTNSLESEEILLSHLLIPTLLLHMPIHPSSLCASEAEVLVISWNPCITCAIL